MSSDIVICEYIPHEDKLFAKTVQDGAAYLWDNSLLCDIGIVVEGQVIEAHRSILASSSCYFRGMFCAGLKETGQNEVTIHDVDYEAMKSVIRFFYTSCITLTEENIFEVVNVADLLGVASLQAACSALLRRCISVRNCVSVYIICQRHGYSDVASKAVRLASRNFSHLMETEEFLDMPYDMLMSCLESKMLNVCTENSLLNRICAWVQHDLSGRERHLPALLDQVNVYGLDLAMAESSLYQLPSAAAQAYKWLDRARRLRDRGLTLSTRNHLRFTKEHQIVLSCGGRIGEPVASVEALAAGDTMWRCTIPWPSQALNMRVVPPLKVPRVYAASTYTDHHVYVIGGRGEGGPLASVERYCVDANEWDEFVPLPEPLEGAAATVCNGSVYVTGGFNNTINITNKGWVLDPGQRSWRPLPPMIDCRCNHGLLAVDGYLYAVAGAGPDGKVLCSVERMSIHAQQWQRLSPLQEPRSHFASVVIDSKIFVLGGMVKDQNSTRSVQVYDTLTHEWASETPLSIGRHSHGATVADGRIYVSAGSECVHYLATCEQFNPNTHAWHCKPSLARPRVGATMATITLPISSPPNI